MATKNKEKNISKRELAREERAEENIISTICGNTTSYQRKVSAEWVALASGTRDIEKVKKVANKYGLKTSDNDIDLSGRANMGKAYAEILKKRQKELDAYLKRKRENKLKKKAQIQAVKNTKKSKGAKNEKSKKSKK